MSEKLRQILLYSDPTSSGAKKVKSQMWLNLKLYTLWDYTQQIRVTLLTLKCANANK